MGASLTLETSTSLEAALSVELSRNGWSRDIDVLFVDTEKSYTSTHRDILLWGPRVALGGCVSGHDFASFWMGTVQAVLEEYPDGAELHFGSDHVWWWCK